MSVSTRCTGIRLSGDTCAIATVEAGPGDWSLDLDRCFVLQLPDRGQATVEDFHADLTDLFACADIRRVILRYSQERGTHTASPRASMMEAALKLSPDVIVADVAAAKISSWRREYEPNLPTYRGALPGRAVKVLQEAIEAACFGVEAFTREHETRVIH
jgi:hypothetical protein